MKEEIDWKIEILESNKFNNKFSKNSHKNKSSGNLNQSDKSKSKFSSFKSRS